MSLIWLNCLRQLKDDVEKDKKNMEKLKEIKDVTCFLYIYENDSFYFVICQDLTTVTIFHVSLFCFEFGNGRNLIHMLNLFNKI